LANLKLGKWSTLYLNGPSSWKTQQVRDECIINTPVDVEAKDNYIYSIAELGEDIEVYLLMAIKLPFTKEKI